MSFGFGVGDFLAVGSLCWKLYQNVYKISRDAPEELRGIRDELGALSNTIRLLTDDIQDPDSILKQPGQESRLDLAADIMKNTNLTLEKLQALAEKHELGRTLAAGKSRRQYLKIQWDKLKFAREWSSITDLRAKLLYHNNQLSLLLQVLNNSSLERLQKEEQRTQKLIEDVHKAVYGAPNMGSQQTTAPFLSTKSVEELTRAFLKSSQSGTRPWASIGVDNWLQAGRWWLIKAQSSLYTALQEGPEYNQAFADLLKSSWILTNIISMHPQRKLIVSTDPRDHIIEGLAQALKAEHEKLAGLSLPEPSLEQLYSTDLSIWASSMATTLFPVRDERSGLPGSTWKTQDGDILWQSFGYYSNPSENQRECILILEVQSQRRLVTLIAQSVDGQDIVRSSVHTDEIRRGSDYFFQPLWSSTFQILTPEKYKGIEQPYYPSQYDDYSHPTSQALAPNDYTRTVGTFRFMNTESFRVFYVLYSAIRLFAVEFGDPPINVRSLESAAIIWCSFHESVEDLRLLQRFGIPKGPPHSGSCAETECLSAFESRAISCSGSFRASEPSQFMSDTVYGQFWPHLIWLSPTADSFISLALNTRSVPYLKQSLYWCMLSAFAKGCSLFFSRFLEGLEIPTQGRWEWIMNDDFNPEGRPLYDGILLLRAIQQSRDHTLLNFFLEITPFDHRIELTSFLREAARSADKAFFGDIMMHPSVKKYLLKRDIFSWEPDYFFREVLRDFPAYGLEWFLDFLHEIEEEEEEVPDCISELFRPSSLDYHFEPVAETNFWIIPAILRQDREIVGLFLDRNIAPLYVPPFISEFECEDSCETCLKERFVPMHSLAELLRHDGYRELRIPPVGMPDFPLYCAIFLAFEPGFVSFLCGRGASISDPAEPVPERTQDREPAVIKRLDTLKVLQQARQSFGEAWKLISSILPSSIPEYTGGHSLASISARQRGGLPIKDNRAFCAAGAIVKEHYPWLAEKAGLGDPSVKAELPPPLRTQASWDKWRTEVLQILREHHARASESITSMERDLCGETAPEE